MKALLFLFATLFSFCMFSGCRESSRFYHIELPCGKVNGDVKRVIDTTYSVIGGEIKHLLGVSEYGFDSCHRLAEEHHSLYYTTGTDEEASVSVCYRGLVRNRYDRDGRKVESHKRSYTYENDSVQFSDISMSLARLDGNHEIWTVTSTNETGEVLNTQMSRQYGRNRILTHYTEDVSQEKSSTLQLFDDSGNLVECSPPDKSEVDCRTVYIYDKEGQLIELLKSQADPEQTHKTIYQPDEYDNEGNWLKRTTFDGNNEVKTITRRRIEYRI